VDGKPYQLQCGDRFNYFLTDDTLVCYPDRRGEASFLVGQGEPRSKLQVGSYWSDVELVVLLNRTLREQGSPFVVKRVENSWPNVFTFEVIAREERKSQ